MDASDRRDGLILVTGGAGFIGSNLVAHYLSGSRRVRLYDNLSRIGAECNLTWLESLRSDCLEVVVADVRDYDELRRAAREASTIIHLASQVAVTTSLRDPRTDFEVNALGAFNALEAARESGRRPVVLLSSTNKVYGGMEGAGIALGENGYRCGSLPHGVPEDWPLDFHSPYGCSKGAADQYTRDYARIYGLPTVVLRQSCVYGPRQFGVEDQGWVAHFAISAAFGKPITVYGDGHQVRDVLHVDDLISAYDLAVRAASRKGGRVFNIGGGPENAISLRRLVSMLGAQLGQTIEVEYGAWRPGDQRVYVSDIRKAAACIGWRPRISAEDGVGRLLTWVRENRQLFAGTGRGE